MLEEDEMTNPTMLEIAQAGDEGWGELTRSESSRKCLSSSTGRFHLKRRSGQEQNSSCSLIFFRVLRIPNRASRPIPARMHPDQYRSKQL
jgi:hypothetical protein